MKNIVNSTFLQKAKVKNVSLTILGLDNLIDRLKSFEKSSNNFKCYVEKVPITEALISEVNFAYSIF